MRFKIHKRNAFVVSLTAFLTLSLVYIMRKNDSSNVNRGNLNKDSGRDSGPLPYVSTRMSPMNTFQFDTVPNMKKSVYESNFKQFIQNADQFPADFQLVLVVQVHNRPAYLKMLVDSLSKVSDVHDLLVIFSHDYFSEEIHSIIQGIRFCKVLQIYFPFSTQLYPNQFPGQDPQDCPRDISKEEALRKGCLNAECPDSYGHYREASFTQTKHHWWWKLHFVWERVRVLQGYSGYIVFMEEDNYLLPDFYHCLKGMAELKKQDCPDCDILVLGSHDAPGQFEEHSNKMETTGWLSTRHNIGMAFTKETYYKLMGCNTEFCSYDDYNWDWTIQHLSGTCISKPLKVLAVQAARVLHTGNCGLHQKEACQPDVALQRVEDVLRSARQSLFPQKLVLSRQEAAEHKAHVKNGGWGDIRDHALCKNYGKIL
ncbi:alpha-1,6-mannosyl-glycoprotein 2-beta-N-acetylglucosaminyltransferase [Megalops cyprinoides]|uniref:alpha-1,6-mannosyl-glycoprotein 2-beta-N-acetylglucosaminyltransferase n=1 Tax=Megalops cyprinoides TaxID=118141 RepID=UPI0018648053|nr:alpha-1,6-mannosyl-glycoprotein 2-beta-N-acetylglucosaminyltransferase [Megalops cyprinoides]